MTRKSAAPGGKGFTLTETTVAVAALAVLTASALYFFQGRYSLARQHTLVGHLSEAIRIAEALPAGNPLTWEVAAHKALADSLDAAVPSAATPAGTRANSLTDGLHIGLGAVANQALMSDATGAAVALTGCAVGDIQITVYPDGLPADNELRESTAEWLSSNLEIAIPTLLVTVQEEGVFCCLPRI